MSESNNTFKKFFISIVCLVLATTCTEDDVELLDKWLEIEVIKHNRTATKLTVIDSVFVLPFDLDFTKGGWSVGNGFYDVYGDREQAGNFRAVLYNKDIELLGENLEINTAILFLDGVIYDNGVRQDKDSLISKGRIKLVNNLSYFEQRN